VPRAMARLGLVTFFGVNDKWGFRFGTRGQWLLDRYWA
jgi:hypothetical protein